MLIVVISDFSKQNKKKSSIRKSTSPQPIQLPGRKIKLLRFLKPVKMTRNKSPLKPPLTNGPENINHTEH